MTTIDSEPRPGTTFKKIVEERTMLNEFMGMIGKKMEADKRRLDDLIDLKKTWNPKWGETGVWELMSPILGYFTDEINHLIAAQEDLSARFNALQNRDEPVSLVYACEGRMDPVLGIGEALEKVYVACEGCRQSTHTPEAQQAIARAMEKRKEGTHSHFILGIRENPGILLPVEDRAYRVAVNMQHQILSPVKNWYANELHGIVEQHQQRAEDMKTFLLGYCGSVGKLASDLSASCSYALHSNQAFASTRFIAPRHEEIEQERSHLILRKFDYRNAFDGRIVEPILGLGPQRTLTLAHRILNTMNGRRSGPTPILHSRDIDWVFDLEEQILTSNDLAVEIRHRGRYDLDLLLKVALWSDVPLFPISSHYLDEYSKGVPRQKLRQIINLIMPGLRGGVMELMQRILLYQPTSTAAGYLCHTKHAEMIISDIWRKWDFEKDRPLPDGVTRSMTVPESKVWTKTGVPYSG